MVRNDDGRSTKPTLATSHKTNIHQLHFIANKRSPDLTADAVWTQQGLLHQYVEVVPSSCLAETVAAADNLSTGCYYY